MSAFVIHQGDALTVLRTLPESSVNCCITSPPYWGLRDYGTAVWEGGQVDCDHSYNHGVQGKTGQRADRTFTGQAIYKKICGKCGACRTDQQIGLEETPGEWVYKMVEVFREVRRVLRGDGTLWVNIGDSYCSGTGADRLPTTTKGGRIPASWSNRAQPQRIRAVSGLKAKDLCMMPARLAIALQEDGWWLRSDIIWAKPNPMPESVNDRPTKSHEYLYLLAKEEVYHYDSSAIRELATGHTPGTADWEQRKAAGEPMRHGLEGAAFHKAGNFKAPKLNGSHGTKGQDGNGMRMPDKWDNPRGRNKRSVWTMATQPTPEAHFATFPLELPETCMRAGCPINGIVLDPSAGAGTTGLACLKNGRNFIGIELNPDYIEIAHNRARKHYPLLVG